jgi:hypothetical protein
MSHGRSGQLWASQHHGAVGTVVTSAVLLGLSALWRKR